MRSVFILLVTALLVSCMSSPLGKSEVVIERSAFEKPAWAEGDFSEEGASEAYLVYKRDEVYRLELGIKQTEAAAIHKTKDLVLDRARIEIEETADSLLGGKSDEIENAIVNAMNAVLESKFTVSDAAASTVYWENVRNDTPEGSRTYYNVYVLLTVKRPTLDSAIFEMAKVMQKDSSPDAQNVAGEIVKQMSESTAPPTTDPEPKASDK